MGEWFTVIENDAEAMSIFNARCTSVVPRIKGGGRRRCATCEEKVKFDPIDLAIMADVATPTPTSTGSTDWPDFPWSD